MPSNLDYLREYTGTAGDQMLVADITAAVLVMTIDGASGWPTGAHPFVITINAGSSNEEKVLVTTRTGNTLSVQQRGFDGTPASTHSAGEKVQHTDSAFDFTAFNAHGSASSGVHGVTGNVVGDTDAMSLSNKVLVQPEIDDHSLANHDHSSVPQGGLLSLPVPVGLTLVGTWANSGGGSALASYVRDPFGRVHVQGTVFTNAIAGAVSIATGLPVPTDGKSHAFSVVDLNGTAHVLALSATGVLSNLTTNFAANAAVGLDGISYQS